MGVSLMEAGHDLRGHVKAVVVRLKENGGSGGVE
jgi:hypothetical protein